MSVPTYVPTYPHSAPARVRVGTCITHSGTHLGTQLYSIRVLTDTDIARLKWVCILGSDVANDATHCTGMTVDT
jgi:hypothetical protein